ncbi:hypothetical protein Tco_0712531 [Tanacetum coccineum]
MLRVRTSFTGIAGKFIAFIPPSPLTSLSPPSVREHLARCTDPSAHSSPPPMPSPLLPLSGCPTQIQTLRIAFTQALIDVVTVALPSSSLPPLPLSLYIPPPIDHRDDVPNSEQPPRKRSCLFALGSRYEVRESSTTRPTRDRRVDYRDTWVDQAEAVPDIAPMTVEEVNTRVTELAELHECDTQDLYALLEDAQDSRTRISQRVDMDSQRVDLLMGDRITLQETVWIVKEEAYASREAWAHSVGLNQAIHMKLLPTVSVGGGMHTSPRSRHIRHSYSCRAELLVHREQQRKARQLGPDTRISDHHDASRDPDSHI